MRRSRKRRFIKQSTTLGVDGESVILSPTTMWRIRHALSQDPQLIDRTLREFPHKLSSVAGKIPFAHLVTAAYFAVRDPRTPLKVKATLGAALLYFIVPVDFIPDVVAFFGFTDDLTVLTLAVRRAAGAIRTEHHESARRFLQSRK